MEITSSIDARILHLSIVSMLFTPYANERPSLS